MYLNSQYLKLLLYSYILLISCQNNSHNTVIEKSEIKSLKEDTTTVSEDKLKIIEKQPSLEDTINSPQISTVAPTVTKCAKNNTLFDPEKWLKSDRNSYMKLHPGRISEYDRIIKKYARRYGFDWRLIAAQIYAESNFRNEAQSHVGAMGLMQVMPGTAKFMGFSPESMVKPDVNIMAGCLYNQRMYNLWGRQTKDLENRLAFALASYNAGRGRVLRSYDTDQGITTWDLVHPSLPHETQSYVHKIFLKYQHYKKTALP